MQLENSTALTLSLSPKRRNSLWPRWDESLVKLGKHFQSQFAFIRG